MREKGPNRAVVRTRAAPPGKPAQGVGERAIPVAAIATSAASAFASTPACKAEERLALDVVERGGAAEAVWLVTLARGRPIEPRWLRAELATVDDGHVEDFVEATA